MNYLYAMIGLQIADALTTYLIIKRGGRELNPVLLWFAEKLKSITNAKWAWLVIAKILAAAAAIAAFPYMPEWLQLALCVFYLFVVVRNGMVMWRDELF